MDRFIGGFAEFGRGFLHSLMPWHIPAIHLFTFVNIIDTEKLIKCPPEHLAELLRRLRAGMTMPSFQLADVRDAIIHIPGQIALR